MCISGIFNKYKEKGEYIKKFIINPLKANVFISTNKNVNEEDIINFYKPSLYHFSDRKLQVCKFIKPGTEMMFYRIDAANKLKKQYEKKHNFKFDIVIRIRPDISIYNNIPKKCINNIQNNTIYYPSPYENYFIQPSIGCPCGGINDMFAIGNSKTIDIYSNIFKYLDNKKIYQNTNLPEEFLYTYLLLQNVNIETIKYTAGLDWYLYPINIFAFISASFEKINEGYLSWACMKGIVKHYRKIKPI